MDSQGRGKNTIVKLKHSAKTEIIHKKQVKGARG